MPLKIKLASERDYFFLYIQNTAQKKSHSIIKYWISLIVGIFFDCLNFILCCLLTDYRFLSLSCQTHVSPDDYKDQTCLMVSGNRIPDKHDPGAAAGPGIFPKDLLLERHGSQGYGTDGEWDCATQKS